MRRFLVTILTLALLVPCLVWAQAVAPGVEQKKRALCVPNGIACPAVDATNGLPVTVPAGGSMPVEGVVAEGAPAATADPLVGGSEARALGLLPAAVDAGDAIRDRSSLSGIKYVTWVNMDGTLAYGTAGTPVRTDPTGATIQPVNGTVTANQGAAGVAWPVDTELPAAAALTDADPNPTVPGVASHLMGWVPGGPVWERIRSSGTGAIQTDLQLVDGAQPAFGAGVTTTNTFRVVPASAPATAALYDPDQLGAVTFAAAATRKTITCQVVGTTQVLVREGAATGGVCCHRFNGGAVANDGLGDWFQVTSVSDVYLYDVTGAGNADVACTTEVYP